MLKVEGVAEQNLARIVQLHMRTNQFNLTTLRFDEAIIGKMMAEPEKYLIISGRVGDKFGDHGIVVAAIAEMVSEEQADILTFMMSCRVIGREVETAFLQTLVEQLRERGAVRVRGRYIPTTKNAQVAKFYAEHGFQLLEEQEATKTWMYNCASDFLQKVKTSVVVEFT